MFIVTQGKRNNNTDRSINHETTNRKTGNLLYTSLQKELRFEDVFYLHPTEYFFTKHTIKQNQYEKPPAF